MGKSPLHSDCNWVFRVKLLFLQLKLSKFLMKEGFFVCILRIVELEKAGGFGEKENIWSYNSCLGLHEKFNRLQALCRSENPDRP